jgi:hypothetical protein
MSGSSSTGVVATVHSLSFFEKKRKEKEVYD